MRTPASMDYSAPWSRFLIVLSAVLSVLMIALSGVSVWSNEEPRGFGVALAALLPAILFICLLFMIRGYRLDGAQLYVRRLLWETAVDLRGLESVDFDPQSVKGSIKLFGNGGMFSVSGIFWSKKLGRYRAFVTDHSNAVVLRVSARTIVVSPADPEDFVRDLRESHPQLRRAEQGKGMGR